MLACGGEPVNIERGIPTLRQVVLDCTDARALAEFYRQLLGLRYRPGDEPPAAGEPDPAGQDWLVLRDPAGGTQVAFHRSDDVEEPLRVYADPAGHPFCLFVVASAAG
jgi:catechol 2,3-dioxygenase-like lactoylglutathione lyase family enzyme